MSDARKRKLQASLSKSTELPESLRFVPSSEPPTNGPHAKKQKIAQPTQPSPKDYEAGLFNLQTLQLLQTISASTTEADDTPAKLLASLTKQIKGLQDTGVLNLTEIQQMSTEAKLLIPFERPPPSDTQLPFQYAQPNDIFSTGLTSLNILPYPDNLVQELCVEIPKEVIQEKDYLNHRIHHKIAFYMFNIARQIKSKYTVTFEVRGSFGSRQKVLRISYKDRAVVVIPRLPFDAFDENKLLPTKNADRSVEGSTSQYNNGVLLLMRHQVIMDLLREATVESPGFQDAILLAHRVLSRKSLPIDIDQWAVITASLLSGGGKNGGKVLSPNASALQLFRGTVLFLEQFLERTGATVSFGGPQELPGFWVRGIDIFASMSEQQRSMAAYRIKDIMALLMDEHRDPVRSFEKIFLEADPVIGNFDLEIRIGRENSIRVDVDKIWRVLIRALGARVKVVSVTQLGEGQIRVGMHINREEAQSSMILGPAANMPEAKSFQGLWGTLAELRKFKDGRILESVSLAKLNPTLDACKKIMSLHFPQLPNSEEWTVFGEDRPEESVLALEQKKITSEFDEFARLARELDNLPLRILNIVSAHPVTSATASGRPNSIDGIIQFESSARWPDDLEAIQRTKVAFLLALIKPFSTVTGVSAIETRLENQPSTSNDQRSNKIIINIGLLVVQMSSGTRYHLRIHHDREKTLLKAFLNSGLAKNDRQLYNQHKEALELYEETYIINETHRQVIRSLTSIHSALSEATILLKSWFSAHLLESHFSDRAIELLALNCFVNDSDVHIQSPSIAFIRTMQFLSKWDWRLDAMILTEDLKEHKERVDEFDALKHQSPGHSMMIYPPYAGPPPIIEKVAALRMTSLAKVTYSRLQAGDPVSSTMVTPLNHFDFVVTLNDNRPKTAKYKNLATTSSQNELVELQNLFKEELKRIYQQALYFFTSHSSTQIGVLVDPALKKPRKFRPNLGYPTTQASQSENQEVVMGVDLVIEEIARLGEGLIKRVTTRA